MTKLRVVSIQEQAAGGGLGAVANVSMDQDPKKINLDMYISERDLDILILFCLKTTRMHFYATQTHNTKCSLRRKFQLDIRIYYHRKFNREPKALH